MTEVNDVVRGHLGKVGGHLPLLPKALRLIWDASRRWSLAWFGVLAVSGALPAAIVYLSRLVVDSLVAALGAGGSWETLRPAAIWIGLTVILTLAQVALRSLGSYIQTVQSELLKDHIRALIHRQSASVDLAFYDAADYYDHLFRARSAAEYRPVRILENLGGFFQNSVTMLAMIGILMPYGWWIPLVLVVSTLPAFYVVIYHKVRLYAWRRKTTADERRTWYYDWLLTDRHNAAELRLFGLADHAQSVFRGLRERLRGEQFALARDESKAELWSGLSAMVVTGGVTGWMVWRAGTGQATLGDVALFYQAFSQGQGITRGLMGHLGDIYTNSLFLGDLFEFLGLKPTIEAPAAPTSVPVRLVDGIQFEDVHLSYPESGRPVLEGFDLFLPAGRITAIVGANGAGKSTLVKLLCRLYDPTSGRITFDGIDSRSFDPDELRRAISVIFQDPVEYHDTAMQNIAYGDLGSNPDEAEIRGAALAAAADEMISALPSGYETLLGKWFGGAELSQGEWQRLALARAFLRNAPVMILDEPTSAMDSWAEADWFGRFRDLATGRTAMVITHRFTTARHADVIHVMDSGRIVESGSHAELVASGGRYAESWLKQVESDAG